MNSDGYRLANVNRVPQSIFDELNRFSALRGTAGDKWGQVGRFCPQSLLVHLPMNLDSD